MKKIILSVSLCCLFVLSACDSEFEILGIEIAAYPNKLFYVIGLDDSLALDGGAILLIRKKDMPKEQSMVNMNDESPLKITHNIDFNTKGVYTVTCVWGVFTTSFPVVVVSIEEIEAVVDSINAT